MKLGNAKTLFDTLRCDVWRIIPTVHVLFDHPERKFTADLIIGLIQGRGRLVDNKMPAAVSNSFMWLCKDEADRPCELVIKFEPLDMSPNEMLLVISAYRKVK